MDQARERRLPPPPPSVRPSGAERADAPTVIRGGSSLSPVTAADSEESVAATLAHVSLLEEEPVNARPATTASTTPDDGLLRGRSVGRYIIIEVIGSGGLGQVYSAYDPQLERQVAIKVLRSDLGRRANTTASRMHERLLREAQALARLSHPNVVAVHDVGTIDESIFVAMEKVAGVTLSRWRRQEKRPWQEIRDVFVQAGRGLAAAHEHGIIHRDFKPSNVIVSPDGRVRVLDFGLARATQEPGSRVDSEHSLHSHETGASLLEAELTQVGTVMGTPAYMAPEQLRGLPSVGPAADQFGFCVALWETLYGKRPFPKATNLEERVSQIETRSMAPPGDTRGIPSWLHRALLKGLSPKPVDRFETMSALLTELERDRRSRRRNYSLVFGAALVSALVTGASSVFFRPVPTPQQRGVLEELMLEARAAAAKSYFVYPPTDDPEQPTAYRKVLELEEQERSVGEEALTLARELRAEFADTLVRLGDRYWNDGGKPFAIDYYAAALMFEPEHTHARTRALLTPGELAALREKASEGSFSEAELIAAEPLTVLAEPNASERSRKLSKLRARRGSAASTAARLDRVLKIEEPPAKAEPVVPAKAPEPEVPQVVVEEPEVPEPPVAKVVEPKHVEPGLKRERRDLAREVVAEAKRAFQSGQIDRAESLYHRALGHDRQSLAALSGLSELYFERGAYPRALKYAKLAVAAAPRHGAARITLGDAYFKVHAYENARQAYEEGLKLGDQRASQRLA